MVTRLSRRDRGARIAAGALFALIGSVQFAASASAATVSWRGVALLGGASAVNIGVPTAATPTTTCWSAGNCVAVGTYFDHLQRSRIYAQSESGGVWQSPATVSANGAASYNAQVSSVSCGGPGECVGVGQFADSSFIEEDRAGVWQSMSLVPGLGASIPSQLLVIDCVAAGSCTAAGKYTTSSGVGEIFTVTELNGVWGNYKAMIGSGALGLSRNGTFDDATPDAISCATATDCVVGGYLSNFNSNSAGYLYEESGGVWHAATLVTSVVGSGISGQFAGAVTSVSCPAAGACVAGGFYPDANGFQQAFLRLETNFLWTQEEVPGTAALNVTGGISFTNGITLSAALTSLSCSSVGECTAVGYFGDASAVEQGFVATETSHTWQSAVALPGLASLNVGASRFNYGASPSAVTCAAVGNCHIVGTYTDTSGHLQYFTADDTAGVVGNAAELPGSSSLPTQYSSNFRTVGVSDLWCDTSGDCLVAGPLPRYSSSSSVPAAFTAVEDGGTWESVVDYFVTATLTVGASASVTSTQCPTVGDCVSVGEYTTASGELSSFVVQESHGTWGSDSELTGLASLAGTYVYVTTLSCSSVGYCTIGGSYVDSSGNSQSFYELEIGGIWQPAVPITSVTAYEFPAGSNSYSVGVDLTDLVCTSSNNCVGIGEFQATASLTEPFLIVERAGTWSTITSLPGLSTLHVSGAGLNLLSCVATGYCLATGQYSDHNGRSQSLLIVESKGVWTPAITVPGTAKLNVGPIDAGGSYVTTATCATAGNCVLAGEYVNSAGISVPYIDAEQNGLWGHAFSVPGMGTLLGNLGANWESSISITSVACTSPGNCVFIGTVPVYLKAITKSTSIFDQTEAAFEITEQHGSFATALKIVTKAPNSASVSSFVASGFGCFSAVSCVVVGEQNTISPITINGQIQFVTTSRVVDITETSGVWGQLTTIAGLSQSAQVAAMDCRAGVGCAIGGSVLTSNGRTPFMVSTT